MKFGLSGSCLAFHVWGTIPPCPLAKWDPPEREWSQDTRDQWIWQDTKGERGEDREEERPEKGGKGASATEKAICWPLCFPGGFVGRDPLASAGDTGDMGLISGSGRSLEVGSGNLLQCSHLENSRDRVAWWAAVQGVAKSWTQLSTHILCLSSLSGALRVFHGDFPTFVLSV